MSDDDDCEVPPPPPAHPHPDTIQQQQQQLQQLQQPIVLAPLALSVSSPLAADADLARGRRSRRESRAEEHAQVMAMAVAVQAAEEQVATAAAAGRGSMTLPPASSPAPPHSRRSRAGSLSVTHASGAPLAAAPLSSARPSSRSHSRRGSLGPLHITSDPTSIVVVAAVASAAGAAALPDESNGGGATAAVASAASIAASSPISSPASAVSSSLSPDHLDPHSASYDSLLSPSSPPFTQHHLSGGHSFKAGGGARKQLLDVLSPQSQSRSQTRLTRGMSEWIMAHSPFSPVSGRRGEHMGFGAGSSSTALTSGASFRGLPPPPLASSPASAKDHASAGSSSCALVSPAPSRPVVSSSSFLPPPVESIVEKGLSALSEFFHRVTTPRVTTPQPTTAAAAAPTATGAADSSAALSPSPRQHRTTSRVGAPTTITTSAAAIQETGQRKRSDTQSDASPDQGAELRRIMATRTRSPTAASLAASSPAAASACASPSDLSVVVETREPAQSLSNAHFTFSPPSVPRKISAIPLHGVPEATETELFHVSFQTKSRARLAAAAAQQTTDSGLGSGDTIAEEDSASSADPRASVSVYSQITPSKILSEEEEEEEAAALAQSIAEEDEQLTDDEEEEEEEEDGFGGAVAQQQQQPDFSGISSEQATRITAAETLSTSKASASAAAASSSSSAVAAVAAASTDDDASSAAPFDIDSLLSDDEFSFFDSLSNYGFPDESPLRFAWLGQYSAVIQKQELAWEAAMSSEERHKGALTEKQYKALTRQGIPAHFRAKIWWSWLAPETLLGTTPPGSTPLPSAAAAASSSSAHPTLVSSYQSYLHAPCDEEVLRNILKDVDRTFTTHALFRDPSGPGCRALRNVLVAFANRNNSIGYCQSLNFLAAWFLIFYGCGSATAMASMGNATAAAATAAAATSAEGSTEGDGASSIGSVDPSLSTCSRAEPLAFWMLCALVEKFLPARYFDSTMLGVAGDVAILLELVRLRLPKLWAHLGSLECQSLEGIVTSWFLCGFLKTVPVETALRIWDCMFVEGSKVLFRVGLALVVEHERALMALDDFGSAFNAFNQLGSAAYDCDRLLKVAFGLKSIKRGWIEAQRRKQQTILTKRFHEMEARRLSIEASHAAGP